MEEIWIKHVDLPEGGQEFSIADQEIWLSGMDAHAMDCRCAGPLEAHLLIMPQERGFLLVGGLSGSIFMPCRRCAEDVEFPIGIHYEEFEGLDAEDGFPEDELVRDSPDGLLLNLSEFLWEQFVLALPDYILCRNECRGLCAHCGSNLNEGLCACGVKDADPRLESLRNLKLS